MKILNGKYDGDMIIQGEVRLNGRITGSATVSEGALLELTGTVVGNLNIEPGSTVYLHGMVPISCRILIVEREPQAYTWKAFSVLRLGTETSPTI